MKSPSLENFQTKHRTLRQLEVFKYFRLDGRGCLGHGSPDVSHGWTVHSPLLGGATHSTSPPRLMGCGALFENPWARTAFFFSSYFAYTCCFVSAAWSMRFYFMMIWSRDYIFSLRLLWTHLVQGPYPSKNLDLGNKPPSRPKLHEGPHVSGLFIVA